VALIVFVVAAALALFFLFLAYIYSAFESPSF
jgi:hypothetical protein